MTEVSHPNPSLSWILLISNQSPALAEFIIYLKMEPDEGLAPPVRFLYMITNHVVSLLTESGILKFI